MTKDKSIELQALGRSAHLGALYDVRSESFCQGSIFNTNQLPADCVQTLDDPSTELKVVRESSLKSKFSVLDVSVHLKISVLLGMVCLKGAGRYLKEDRSSESTVYSSIVYKLRRKKETANAWNQSIKPHINMEALTLTKATHYVDEIIWGGEAFAEFKCRQVDTKDRIKIEASLQAAVNAVVASVSGDGSVDLDKLEENKEYGLSILVYGDFIMEDELPQTWEETFRVMGKLPSRLEKTNEGRGVPITLNLTPISELIKFYSFEIALNNVYKSISSGTTSRIEQIFEKLHQAIRKMRSVTSLLDSEAASCLRQDTVDKILQYDQKAQLGEARLRANLKLSALSVRGSTTDESDIDKQIQDFLDSPFGTDKIISFAEQQSRIQAKMEWYNLLLKKGVKYLLESKGDNIESAFLLDANLYVLVIGEFTKCVSTDRFRGMHHLLQNLILEQQIGAGLEGADRFDFYIFEKDVNTGCQATIHQYLRGELVTEDVEQYRADMSNINTIHYQIDIEIYESEPARKKIAKIKCPGSILGECSTEALSWTCWRCRSIVEYGFDEYFYCQCGRENYKACLYMCNDPKHGKEEVPFTDGDKLKEMLESL